MRKIFLSYHHDDLLEATAFCKRYAGYFDEIRNLGIDERGEEYAERINSGDSDYVMQKIREDYMAGTTCTVVLIGKCTWARRYIDWEIAATLRNNVNDPKSGLIAVQLGSAERNGFDKLPPRLDLNIAKEEGQDNGYCRFYPPPPSDGSLADWVEEAITRRDSMEPATGSTTNLRANNSSCE